MGHVQILTYYLIVGVDGLDGAAADNLDAGGALQPEIQELDGVRTFHIGYDAGVECDQAAGRYVRAPLSFPKPDVIGDLFAGLGAMDVYEYDAAEAPVASSQDGGEANALSDELFEGLSVFFGFSQCLLQTVWGWGIVRGSTTFCSRGGRPRETPLQWKGAPPRGMDSRSESGMTDGGGGEVVTPALSRQRRICDPSRDLCVTTS